MPTFPEVRNEQYEASRKRRLQVEEKKPKREDSMFSSNFNFSNFEPSHQASASAAGLNPFKKRKF